MKAPLSKSGIRSRVSRVRIPPSPPLLITRGSGDHVPELFPSAAYRPVDTKISTVAYCLRLVHGGRFISTLGEVLEWTNRRAWKARRLGDWSRGFESRPLRHSLHLPFLNPRPQPCPMTTIANHNKSAANRSGFQVYPFSRSVVALFSVCYAKFICHE